MIGTPQQEAAPQRDVVRERFDAEVYGAGNALEALEAARRALLRGLLAAPHALYVIEGTDFVPVASHRLDPWPRFAVDGPLARAVGLLGGPVTTVGSSRARWLCARLDAVDRQALRGMGAIALMPFLSGSRPVAFLVIGGGFDTFDTARLRQLVEPLVRSLDRRRDGPPARGSGTDGSRP